MGIEGLQIGGKSTNPMDILLAMYNNENITMKTQLSEQQFRAMVRLKYLEEVSKPENKNKRGLTILNDIVIPYAMELSVSLQRKSRDEVVKMISTIGGVLMQQESNLANEIKKM